MRSFLDAKAMAKTLRQELSNRNINLGHSECLEVVAKQFGFRDWNTMAAGLDKYIPSIGPGEPNSALPDGWEMSGSLKNLFQANIAPKAGPKQKNALCLRAKDQAMVSNSDWSCIYPKPFSAEKYRGRNVEFSAFLKCDELDREAFLWFRIDNNMQDRIAWIGRWEVPEEDVLSGTRDWSRQSISIHVPEEAATMYFGVTLYGLGSVWLADIAFGETTTPDTRIRNQIASAPQNLDLRVA